MMKQEVREKIQEIIGNMNCPMDFKCAESGFNELCKVKKYGIEDLLECLESNPSECKFALNFGNTYFCKCPLRVYIKEKFTV